MAPQVEPSPKRLRLSPELIAQRTTELSGSGAGAQATAGRLAALAGGLARSIAAGAPATGGGAVEQTLAYSLATEQQQQQQQKLGAPKIAADTQERSSTVEADQSAVEVPAPPPPPPEPPPPPPEPPPTMAKQAKAPARPPISLPPLQGPLSQAWQGVTSAAQQGAPQPSRAPLPGYPQVPTSRPLPLGPRPPSGAPPAHLVPQQHPHYPPIFHVRHPYHQSIHQGALLIMLLMRYTACLAATHCTLISALTSSGQISLHDVAVGIPAFKVVIVPLQASPFQGPPLGAFTSQPQAFPPSLVKWGQQKWAVDLGDIANALSLLSLPLIREAVQCLLYSQASLGS